MTRPSVTPIGDGVFRVDHDGRSDVIYVASAGDDVWVFWDGHVFRENRRQDSVRARARGAAHLAQSLTAPMPATVIKVLVAPGAKVKKGDTVVVLEAMKMELPLRAPADATVTAVNCREGELVQPDTPLVELT